jgi:hypothetical protein
MMTIGKRNFMDSSKAKRRAPHLPQCEDGRARHRKKNRSGFSQKSTGFVDFFS